MKKLDLGFYHFQIYWGRWIKNWEIVSDFIFEHASSRSMGSICKFRKLFSTIPNSLFHQLYSEDIFLREQLLTLEKCSWHSFTSPYKRALAIKGGFFSESAICFSNPQSSNKNYSKSLSWAWNLNKLFTVMGGNFKFQAQDSFLE